MAYGCVMECIPLPVEAINTHRDKPKVRDKKQKEVYFLLNILFLELSI
jgi:hypothetical protein